MVRRTTRALGLDAGKARCLEIQRVDERVNQPNRVVVADQIVQSFRQQCRLVPVLSLYMQKNTRSELRVFFLTETRLYYTV